MGKTLLVIDLSVSKICHQNKSANMFPSFSFTFPSRRLCSTVSVCKIYLLKKKKNYETLFSFRKLGHFCLRPSREDFIELYFLYTFYFYFILYSPWYPIVYNTVQCTLSTVLYVCISGLLSCGAAKTR